MKRISFIALIILIFFAGTNVNAQDVNAQDYRFAAGIRLSSPDATLNNSITGKYFVTDRTAIEGIVAFGNRFGIGGLVEIHNSFDVPGLKWFYGAGAYVGSGEGNTYLGPTGIIGLDYKFQNIPLNLSLDFKPELDFLPEIAAHYPVAFTIRFVFK